MTDEPLATTVARIDERSKATQELVTRLIEKVERLDDRFTPIEMWKQNVDSGRDQLTETVASVATDVATYMANQRKHEREAEARQRAHEAFVSRFANAGLALLSGLLLSGLASLTRTIPAFQTIQGGVSVALVLLIGIALLLTILQLYGGRSRDVRPTDDAT